MNLLSVTILRMGPVPVRRDTFSKEGGREFGEGVDKIGPRGAPFFKKSFMQDDFDKINIFL